jgi:RNA polymerase sigma-70 factor (ECF subfamily)
VQRALIERARDGDREAFSAAAAGSLNRLYGLASLILRDQDRAQDAVQDALVSAWRGIRALRDPDAWDAWLQRSVVRACYRHAKSERRSELIWARASLAGEPSVDDVGAALASRDEIERGFHDLSIDQRAVVVLHFYGGLPLEEVAEVLGVPVGTVKSRLHRATQTLRASLMASDRLVASREGGA